MSKHARRFACAVSVAALVASLSSCSSSAVSNKSSSGDAAAPGVSQSTIKLGLITDLTGPTVAIGKGLNVGAQAYVDLINKNGGVAGRKVELVVKDHAFQPQNAIQAYREIKDDVLALVTVEGEGCTAAVLPEADKDNVFAWPGTFTLSYTKTDHPPVATPYYYEALNAIDFLVEKFGGNKTVGTFNLNSGINNDYGQAVKDAPKSYDVKAGPIVAEAAALKDYTGAVQSVRDGKPDYLLLGTAPAQAASFAATAHSQGLTVPMVGAAVSYSPDVLATAAGQILAKSGYVASPWAPWDSSEPGQKALVAAVGPTQKPDINVQTGWVMAKSLIDLIAKADRAGHLDRAGLKAAMDEGTLDFGGVAPDLNLAKVDGARVPTRESRIYQITPSGISMIKDLFAGKAARAASAK